MWNPLPKPLRVSEQPYEALQRFTVETPFEGMVLRRRRKNNTFRKRKSEAHGKTYGFSVIPSSLSFLKGNGDPH